MKQEEAVQVAIGQVKGFFDPSDEERAAAYELLVELTTRTGPAQLGATDTSLRASLDGIAEVFDSTRSILRQHGVESSKGGLGNISMAVVAVRVLNEVFRPVLSHWDPLLRDHESRRTAVAPEMGATEWERQWPLAPQCRRDLVEMRSSVRAYMDTLGRIAGSAVVTDAVVRAPTATMFRQVALDSSRHPDDMREVRPRQKMTRWMDLPEAVRMLGATRRAKAPTSVPATPPDGPTATFTVGPDEDFWFDYVADMGDAFDGTAPVAWQIGRRRIELPADAAGELPTPPAFLPRPRLMVFGGDEIYPYAQAGGYESQTELPYRMGLDDDAEPDGATLVAIPGNHDWMGGIEHFERMFVSGRSFAEHWKTVQDHLCFHVKLPHGWWVWGIDTGLHNQLPTDQLEYFRRASQELREGDRVILVTPVPLWQLRQKFPDDYATLRSQLDPLIVARNATMPLCLSADTHIFAHVQRIDADGEDHICTGGGGAFLQPTHNIAERIPREGGNAEFVVRSKWPLPSDSRALAAGAKGLFSAQYWSIILVFGAFHALNSILVRLRSPAVPWAPDDHETGWRDAVGWSISSWWSLLLLAVFVVAGSFLFRTNSREPQLSKAAKYYGILLGVGFAASFVAVQAAWRFVDHEPDLDDWTGWLGALLVVLVGGALTLGTYLTGMKWVNGRIQAGDTTAFSPAQLTRYKHFLRFRIGRDGELTCFAIGIDPVGEGWYRAMTEDLVVPPHDSAGIPRLHYVWGKTYPKFRPTPLTVAVSVSDPAADPEGVGELFMQVCGRLVNGGHTLMYGGRLDEGYTARLREIEEIRHADDPNLEHHLINYVPDCVWPESLGDRSFSDEGMMRLIRARNRAADGLEGAERFMSDLTAMRQRMTNDAKARLVIGGDLQPGRPGERVAPGVLEEAHIALEAGVPLLVVGGFGGVGQLLADVLLERLDPADVAAISGHFVDPSVVETMVRRFNTIGLLRNGLDDGENRELLTSRDPETVTALVCRSIERISMRPVRG